MKPRRRTILKALLLLIAGATLNVAVAWVCFWRSYPSSLMTESDFAKGRGVQSDSTMTADQIKALGLRRFGWTPLLGDEWVSYSVVASCRTHFGHAETDIDEHWADGKTLTFYGAYPSPVRIQTLQRAGWPIYSLGCETWYLNREVIHRTSSFQLIRRTNTLSGVWSREITLPLRPLLPGFAINTLFYAGVLWMLFCGPFALRLMIRRRRGQCPACAYPIGQSPVCTECGAAVVKASRHQGIKASRHRVLFPLDPLIP